MGGHRGFFLLVSAVSRARNVSSLSCLDDGGSTEREVDVVQANHAHGLGHLGGVGQHLHNFCFIGLYCVPMLLLNCLVVCLFVATFCLVLAWTAEGMPPEPRWVAAPGVPGRMRMGLDWMALVLAEYGHKVFAGSWEVIA